MGTALASRRLSREPFLNANMGHLEVLRPVVQSEKIKKPIWRNMPLASRFTKDAAMEIVEITVSAHQALCETLGIFAQYDQVQNIRGHIGGKSDKESQDHLLARFLNSAARTQLPLVSQDGPLIPINEQIVAQLLTGEIYIVDIAAGNGAGVISMLNTIAKQRMKNELPKDLLDVHVHAIDFSELSLSYYAQQLEMLQDDYAGVGIEVSFQSHNVDMTDDGALEISISNIKNSIGSDPRFLLVCSAISGVSKKVFKESFSSSYKFIAKAFRGANSSFLWVEPQQKGHWVKDEAQAIYLALDESKAGELSKEICDASMRFFWIDPHREVKEPISTGAEYYLLELAA